MTQGKTLKEVLHVGNILNNGYLHCKYLRKRGIEADCLNVDYCHCQGQPEWAEVYIKGGVDEHNPDWRKVDLGGFSRPYWYIYTELKDIGNLSGCSHAKIPLDEGDNSDQQTPEVHMHPVKRDFLRKAYHKSAPVIGNTFFGKVLRKFHAGAAIRRIIRGMHKPYGNIYQDEEHVTVTGSMHPARSIDRDYCLSLLEEFKTLYPDREKKLSIEDIDGWLHGSLCRKPIFEQYRLIQAYSLDPIYVILGNPGQPFICYEHGTMREFPFDDSAHGRLYALALKKAEKVIITNADCIKSAEKLGLNNYVFIPHIIDDDLFRPVDASPLREELKRRYSCDYIFVAPSRHHWKHCPPGLENSWFKRNDILIRGLGKLFRERSQLKALVVFFEWGQEVELSKKLIQECGFEDRVLWEPIMSKPAVRDYFQAADIILDQFNDGIGTFGAVVPEAMACSKPVILNYKKELHTWCYPELPPAIHAWDEESVFRCVESLLDNDNYCRDVGVKGCMWFKKYHSAIVVIDKMVGIYQEIAEKNHWRWENIT